MRPLPVLTVLCSLATSASAQTIHQLVDRVPDNANAIVMLDLNALYGSPMSQRFGWSGAHEAASYQVPLMVPPEATLAVMAANVDLTTMDATWEVATAVLDSPISVDEIARSEKGYVDTIADAPVVWLSSGAYAIQLDERLLGVAYPDNRQWASRWIRDELPGRRLSAPLNTSASLMSSGTAVGVVVDLTDVASVWQARDFLGVNRFGQTAETDMMELAEALASAQSLSMAIKVDQEANCRIEVTFGKDISCFGDFAKPMLLGVAGSVGMAIPDMESWTPSINGRVFSLEGTLGKDGMMRVLSMMEAPIPQSATPAVAAAPAAPAEPAEPAPTREPDVEVDPAEASQAYFAELSDIVNRLGINANRNMNEASTWFDKSAVRIQRMDINNVDPVLIDLGAEVSNHLRDASRTLEQARQKGMAAAARVTYDAPANYSRRNTSRQRAESRRRMSNRDQQREAAIMQELTRGMEHANESLAEVDSAMREVRRQMNEKYDIPF